MCEKAYCNVSTSVPDNDRILNHCIIFYYFLLQCKYICTSSRIKIELQESPSFVYTDEKWIVFICNQIIENAVKYRVQNNPAIVISIVEDDKKVCLQLVDNGIGIKAEDLPRVIEKGFTGENGRACNMHSTGIGLYLCKKLCDALGITLYVESLYGTKTSVCLEFPK